MRVHCCFCINLKGAMNLRRIVNSLFTLFFVILFCLNSNVKAYTTKYYSEAKLLEKSDIIKGDTKGDLMLEETLQRQDLVIIIARLYSEEKRAQSMTGKLEFKDVDNKAYYRPFIIWAAEKGIMEGKSDKIFGVGDDVTVLQLETILLRILGYEEEAKNSDLIVTLSDSLGLNEGINSRNSDSIKRGELSKMIINALNIERKGSTIKLKDVLNLDIK